jgi:hypothetical protein
MNVSNPLHGYELMFLRRGGILVRRTSRYPLIVMWMTS